MKFGCQDCSKQFRRKSVLNTHKIDIHDGRKHNCEQKERYLKVHENSIHIHRDSNFGCQYCGQKFKRKSSWDRHETNIHKGRKRNVNNMKCDKEFALNLSKTMRFKNYHEQQKHPCTFCKFKANY